MVRIPDTQTIEEHLFADDGEVPNNPSLPVIVYRAVLDAELGAADACKALFAGNDWGAGWIDGIYAQHHYHSTAHEVLGIASGSVRVRLGGERGKIVSLRAGDVVVIPAGVAHKNVGASADLTVVGAYPGGKSPDMHTPTGKIREQALRNIASVALPGCDPVYGKSGPLIERWRSR